MFALSLAFLAIAILAFQADAATFIWTTSAVVSVASMVVHRRHFVRDQATI